MPFIGALSAAIDSPRIPKPSITSWTSSSVLANGTFYYSVAYGNGMYIAVGPSNFYATSTDGNTWTSVAINYGGLPAPTSFWRKIIFAGGKFVAINAQTVSSSRFVNIMTSSDGVNWTFTRALNSNVGLFFDIKYGNGRYVIGSVVYGTSQNVVTSTDGITWSLGSLGDNMSMSSLAFGNGYFIGRVGPTSSNGFFLVRSTDGLSWGYISSPITSGSDTGYIGFANGKFIAIGYSSAVGDWAIMNSTDGSSWSSPVAIGDSTPKSFIFDTNSQQYILSSYQNPTVYVSSDLVSWKVTRPPTANAIQYMTIENSRIMLPGTVSATTTRIYTPVIEFG